ncbi:hypothetical protein [Nostoc sp. NMS8]|nr:hypothetical protein [Nostoc sp. NMS8]
MHFSPESVTDSSIAAIALQHPLPEFDTRPPNSSKKLKHKI